LQNIRDRVSLWKSTLPRVKPYYAIKVNPDPMIVREIVKNDLGFDCSSISEIKLALDCGANP